MAKEKNALIEAFYALLFARDARTQEMCFFRKS